MEKTYAIDEATARRAKEAYSFFDYIPGSASESYRQQVKAAEAIAAEQAEKYPDEADKIARLLDSYARRLADNINAENRNTASCPSVLICGAASFPTRKKERQNSRADTLSAEYTKIQKILERIQKIGTGGIQCGDPHAVDKIKSKISSLETSPDPYGNKKAEIRRLKGRLLELSPDEMKSGKEITINGNPATFENIVAVYGERKPHRSAYCPEDESYYLDAAFTFSDGTRKYKCFTSNEVNADATQISTYGNAENGYKPIWKPFDAQYKFRLAIGQMRGSGNKAVIYSILKDLDPENIKEKETAEAPQEHDGYTYRENTEAMRVQFIFDGKPDESTRETLKANGFRWAPSQGAWQRQLTENGKRAAKQVMSALDS